MMHEGVYIICSCCCRARARHLPNFATLEVAQRLGVRALNLVAAGRHKVVFLVLAMKFVNRVLLLLIC